MNRHQEDIEKERKGEYDHHAEEIHQQNYHSDARGYIFPRLKSLGEAYYVLDGEKKTRIPILQSEKDSQSNPS